MNIILKIFLLLVLTTKSYSLSIEDSIKSTIKSNPKVKIALEKINESKELINYAKGYKLPKITASISGTYLNSEISSKGSKTSPERITDNYQISISQNLYDSGFNDLEIKRSKILFSNEIIIFKNTIQDLILDAINGYLAVINYEKSLEANLKNYDSVSKVLDETRTRFELGSATLYDLQNAEASFALATTNKFAAEQNINIGKKIFKKIIGLEAKNLEEIFDIDKLIDIENLVNVSMDTNLNLILINNEIKNNKILILKEKKLKKSKLDIVGTGSYSDTGRIDNGTETTNGSIALKLTVPIFNKNQNNSNIKKYQSQIIQSEISLIDAKEDLQILILNTFKDFKIYESKMKSNLVIIKSIKTSLSSLKAEYDIGTKTISDFIEEEEKLLNANVNFLDSKKEYLLNYFKLKSYDGSLIQLFEDYLPSVN